MVEHRDLLIKPLPGEVLCHARGYFLLTIANGKEYLERHNCCLLQDCLAEGPGLVRIGIGDGKSVMLTNHAVERSELFFSLGTTIVANGKASKGARVRRAISMPDWQRLLLEKFKGGETLTDDEELELSRDFGKPHTQITNTVLADGILNPRAVMLSEKHNSYIYVGGRNADNESLLIAVNPLTGVVQTIMMTDLNMYFDKHIVESLYKDENPTFS